MNPVTTQRLALHRVTMDDLDDFLALHALESRRPPATITQLLRDFCAVWERGEHGYWRIEFDGRTAGYGGVKPRVWNGRPVWNLYYRMWPAVRGKGIATEMARKAIAVARELHPDWPVLVDPAGQRAVGEAGRGRRDDQASRRRRLGGFCATGPLATSRCCRRSNPSSRPS
jgi:RimJ/RimL family protein N-acetyltransferase